MDSRALKLLTGEGAIGLHPSALVFFRLFAQSSETLSPGFMVRYERSAAEVPQGETVFNA